ncbi:hypothetical protein J2752_001994 [Halarchaeum rubridurum]|uniref:Uncharacterized protein n=1 Tax=Halarchaeum rubridurum TaxID=489911 RepID=A0A830G0A9_9EURY|nr:hypothetical protein [Halarchaeum rubridurum]MBP1955082.1 hypothetical protein [Halarchaeum rubridurum]GGM69085.1 hypothetical protein GCM10009017_19130 [Halarchaeum rubridurum]
MRALSVAALAAVLVGVGSLVLDALHAPPLATPFLVGVAVLVVALRRTTTDVV